MAGPRRSLVESRGGQVDMSDPIAKCVDKEVGHLVGPNSPLWIPALQNKLRVAFQGETETIQPGARVLSRGEPGFIIARESGLFAVSEGDKRVFAPTRTLAVGPGSWAGALGSLPTNVNHVSDLINADKRPISVTRVGRSLRDISLEADPTQAFYGSAIAGAVVRAAAWRADLNQSLKEIGHVSLEAPVLPGAGRVLSLLKEKKVRPTTEGGALSSAGFVEGGFVLTHRQGGISVSGRDRVIGESWLGEGQGAYGWVLTLKPGAKFYPISREFFLENLDLAEQSLNSQLDGIREGYKILVESQLEEAIPSDKEVRQAAKGGRPRSSVWVRALQALQF